MIEATWKRIAGIHLDDDGALGAVWLAHDEDNGVIHVYDCAIFRDTMPAVVQNGITARGRYIPVAWRKQDKDIKLELYEEGGIDMLPDAVEDTTATIARGHELIRQYIGASRLRVDRRVKQWLDEYRMITKDGVGKVPEKGYPLLSATRHALRMLNWAEAETSAMPVTQNAPNVSIV